MRIEVTEKHIEEGREFCHNCAIALAIQDHVSPPWGPEYYVSVHTDHIHVQASMDSAVCEYSLPEEAIEFVKQFDNYSLEQSNEDERLKWEDVGSEKPEPFTFELEEIQ